MSYDVRVTRRDPPRGIEGGAVTVQEWADLVASDPSLETYDPPAGDGSACWTGHPSDEVWLHLADGEIRCSEADTATLRKLARIARVLGGVVIGDDGEYYDAEGRVHDPPIPDAPRRGVLASVGDWLYERRRAIEGRLGAKPFRVGERVRDALGREGVVEGYDHGAMNHLRVRMDDGGIVRRVVLLDGSGTCGFEPASAPRAPRPDVRSQRCAVYLRRGAFYVIPQVLDRHRIWVAETDHLVRVDEGAHEQELGRAVLEALDRSRTDEGLEHDPEGRPLRIAEAAGVKSWSTFIRSARLAGASREMPDASAVLIEPYRKAPGTSWESVPDRSVTAAAEPAAVGRALISLFETEQRGRDG